MLSKPTTDQTIAGVVRDLGEVVLPAITDEPARVAVRMMQQILGGAAVRAAHEIAWMHEEITDIVGAAAPFADDPAVAAALGALDALDGSGLHLAEVQARYDRAGEVLSCVVEAAYALGNPSATNAAQELLRKRSAHEMEIVGQLDLVGRG